LNLPDFDCRTGRKPAKFVFRTIRKSNPTKINLLYAIIFRRGNLRPLLKAIMPALFLSYAREDLEQASRITGQLAAEGVTVWRDQERLYAGQAWPKALGEAIAENDALLLLWSSRAAQSTFVELEWCTALALKKTVLPCLLDQTPLPPALAAIEAVPPARIAAAARKFFEAPADETKSSDPSHTKKVIRQLGEIGGGAPAEVLQKARTAFGQSNWRVQGSVYQAGGDIHIGAPPPQKTRMEKWQAWVAIIAGILTAFSLGVALVRSYVPAPKRPETETSQNLATQKQSLAGRIEDTAGEPLPNVKISLVLGDAVKYTTTDSIGHFSFPNIDGPAEADVTLIAQKDGYQTAERKAELGNPDFNFQMRRK
jgi:TIR domain/Carboxypeptidase regulatory-like domain